MEVMQHMYSYAFATSVSYSPRPLSHTYHYIIQISSVCGCAREAAAALSNAQPWSLYWPHAMPFLSEDVRKFRAVKFLFD